MSTHGVDGSSGFTSLSFAATRELRRVGSTARLSAAAFMRNSRRVRSSAEDRTGLLGVVVDGATRFVSLLSPREAMSAAFCLLVSRALHGRER